MNMNMKKKLKSFFTLKHKANDGFTLVELIVVVAILGILGGVGVPAYSGYVKKANMGADQALVGEVKHALELAYYSNPNFEGGVVVLSLDEAPGAEGLEDAMSKTFGDGWETNESLKLKYNGWSAEFQNSNFYDDEDGLAQLLSTVDDLTGALGGFLSKRGLTDIFEPGFTDYVTAMVGDSTDTDVIADAAVFYVAEVTGNIKPETWDSVSSVILADPTQGVAPLTAAISKETGSTLASAASLYAMAQGFANYCETANVPAVEGKTAKMILEEETENITGLDANGTPSSTVAIDQIETVFQKMLVCDPEGKYVTDYLENHMSSDMTAYSDAMKTATAYSDYIVESNTKAGVAMGDEGYFSSSTITQIFSDYSEGAVFVFALPDKNGVMKITSSIDTE